MWHATKPRSRAYARALSYHIFDWNVILFPLLMLKSVHLRTRSDLNLKRVSMLPVGLKHWPCLFWTVHERSATSARFICLLVLLLKSENDCNSTALFLFFLTPYSPPIKCHYNIDIGALLHWWLCQIPVETVMRVKLSIYVLQQFLIVLRFFLNCAWGLGLKSVPYHLHSEWQWAQAVILCFQNWNEWHTLCGSICLYDNSVPP